MFPLPLLTATPRVGSRSNHIDIPPCLGWCNAHVFKAIYQIPQSMKINAFSYIQIQDLNIENKKWMHHFLKPNKPLVNNNGDWGQRSD